MLDHESLTARALAALLVLTLLFVLGSCATPPAGVPSAESLARAKNCLACHRLDKPLVGPAYRDVANRYRRDPSAIARLAAKVQSGGVGAWGPIPMPANRQVTDTEARALVAWILSLPD
jgi:cytochrome c